MALILIFSLILIPLRTYMLAKYIDLSNGYYTGPEWLMTGMYLLITLFVLFSFILSFYDKRIHQWEYTTKRHRSIQLVSFLCGIFCLLYAGKLLFNWFTNNELFSSMPLLPLLFLLALISALAFFSFPSYVYGHDYKKTTFDFYLCFPGMFSCIVLISMFLQHTIVTTVSENALNLIRVAAQTIFLVFFANLMMGYSIIFSGKWMVLSGMILIVIGLMTTVPVYILSMMGHSYDPYSGYILTANPLDLVMVIFALVIVYCDLRSEP